MQLQQRNVLLRLASLQFKTPSQSHQLCTVASRNAPIANSKDQVSEQGRLAPKGRVCNPKLMTNGARLHSEKLTSFIRANVTRPMWQRHCAPNLVHFARAAEIESELPGWPRI